MDEKIFYDSAYYKVTNKVLKKGSSVYQTKQISNVYVMDGTYSRFSFKTFITGIFFVIIGLILMFSLGWYILGGFIVLLFGWMSYNETTHKPEYWVNINFLDGTEQQIKSENKEFIQKIGEAIENAIRY